MRIRFLSLGVILLFCSSTLSYAEEDLKDPNLCYFPSNESLVRAPDWVCGTPVEGYPIAAVGSYKASESLLRRQAVTDAKDQLASLYNNQELPVAKPIQFTTGPDGTVYALVVIEPVEKNIGSAELQWQRFLGDKAQKELVAEMDRMIEAEFGAPSENSNGKEALNLCYFEGTEIRAPDWICVGLIEGYVGSYKGSESESVLRRQAVINAESLLIASYAASNQELPVAKPIQFTTGPDGTVYALVVAVGKNTDSAEEDLKDPNLCYFSSNESLVRAPDWVCGTPVEGYPIAAVGSYKASESLLRRQAVTDAKDQLASLYNNQELPVAKPIQFTTGPDGTVYALVVIEPEVQTR